MEDPSGILVGRIFFLVCASISLICFLKYEFVARDTWKFMRKYQFKNLAEEPSVKYIKMFRVWSLIVVLIFVVQAIVIGR